MFEPTTGPRVYSVPLGQDFGQSLVDGLIARLQGQPPDALARTVIYVNARRTAIRLHDLFIERGATLLPSIRLITDLAQDVLVPLDLPPPTSALRRKLMLSQLVGRLLEHTDGTAPQSSVFDLADTLTEVLDQFHSEGIPLAKLNDIDVGEHSQHWEKSRQFLHILADFSRDGDNTSSAERLYAAATQISAVWQDFPPDHPVIVAGSTGSRGATAIFMRAVSRLPQGAVVLPGMDPHVPADVWTRLRENSGLADHCQAALSNICQIMDVDPHSVSDWSSTNTSSQRLNELLSLALTPAPVTFRWRQQGPALTPHLAEVLGKASLIEAPSGKEEAAAIALLMRKSVEDEQHCALITPDRDLGRRVAADLRRWGIIPDDSGGEPLHQTPPGIFLRLVADLFGRPLDPKALVELAKHPLTCTGGAMRSLHLKWARRLEVEILRGGSAHVDFDQLSAHVAAWNDADADAWIKWLAQVLAPLDTFKAHSLTRWVTLHRQTADLLAKGPYQTEESRLFDKDAGRMVHNLFNSLSAEADVYDQLSSSDYKTLYQGLLSRESARDAVVAHPLVSIWGTLEARVQGADLVILGGLNEGTWPRRAKADPWMNRTMRAQVGLPPPERQIGLSAHDFQQASAGQQVIWTRSLRDDDAPSVASRWLIRLTNLLDGLGPVGARALRDLRTRGDHWLELARELERPEEEIAHAPRPSPQVPLHMKPDALFVTRIADLINNPYQIYARFILKLKPLDPLVPEMDARLRGSVVHNILEEFSKPETELTPETLVKIAKKQLSQHVSRADKREMWLGRIRTLADWITLQEVKRRAELPTSWRELTGERQIEGLRFTIKAKADRIGQAKDGSLAIFDYKTGAAPGPKDVERYEKQLPLEAAIAEAGGFKPAGKAPVTRLEFISLAGGGDIKPLKLAGKDASLVADTWAGLARLIAAYQDDAFGFTARDRPKNIKYASDYDHLSRFGEWQDTDAPQPRAMS